MATMGIPQMAASRARLCLMWSLSCADVAAACVSAGFAVSGALLWQAVRIITMVTADRTLGIVGLLGPFWLTPAHQIARAAKQHHPARNLPSVRPLNWPSPNHMVLDRLFLKHDQLRAPVPGLALFRVVRGDSLFDAVAFGAQSRTVDASLHQQVANRIGAIH